MRLIENPAKVYTVASFKEPEDVARAFVDVYQKKAAAQMGFKMAGLEPPKGNIALATVTGRTIEEAAKNAERLCEVFKEREAIDAYIVEDEETQRKLWGARDYILHIVAESRGQCARFGGDR